MGCMMGSWNGKLEEIDQYRWRIPVNYKAGMLVPGLIFASRQMIDSIKEDLSLEQVANVAFFTRYC